MQYISVKEKNEIKKWIKHTAKKWSFLLRISSINVTKADLVTLPDEIFNGKFHFLCSDRLIDPTKQLLLCQSLTFILTYKGVRL